MKVFLQALGEQVWQAIEVGWIKPKEAPVDWDEETIKVEKKGVIDKIQVKI